MSGWVSGLTVTWKLCIALRLGVPLSVTITVNRLVVSAWVTSGRQMKTPLLVSIVALVGPVVRLKANVWGGTSGSAAVLVMTSMTPTLIVLSEMAARVGGVFAPVTARVALLLVMVPALLLTITE